MTTSIRTRLGDAPEEGIKAPVSTIASGNLALFDVGMTINGYVIQDNDRVAVAAQTDQTEQGIYVAKQGKDWERATDFNNSDDVINGQLVVDANTTAVYVIATTNPWVPGTTVMNFGLLLSPSGFFWGAITGTLSNQADLQAELDAKSDTTHTHLEADITDLQAYLVDAAGSIALDGEYYARRDAAWEIIDFSVFAPAIHTHVEADITDLQPYLLDAAGSIANNDELYARANNGWQAFSTSSGTVGEIIAWPDEDPPDNFLTCDGSSQNAVTFADLFAVLGYKFGGSGANFNLPDLRGEFIRGTANGSGNDPDRALRTDRGDGVTGDAVGTKQAQALGPHSHTFSAQQNIGGFTDNGGAPDQRSTQQNASTGTTGSGIENDTRPRNVYMNYIIRWTGGGSGITSPPTVEVQDMGLTLTTAVQLLNFEGFAITQPVTDEITITFGASPNSALFCPGYAYNFLNTVQWSIVGLDATILFRPGRRLQFTDGASLYYGIITASTFGAGDTTLTMSMESGDVLTNSITEVCLTTSATTWVPIAEDPFSGGSINDIRTGVASGTQYWVICGDDGKLAYSSDGGLTWTLVTTGTTEHLTAMCYDSTNQEFRVGGNNGVLLDTRGTDPTGTWNLDTTSLPALSLGGTCDVSGIIHNTLGDDDDDVISALVKTDADGDSRDCWTPSESNSWTRQSNLGASQTRKSLHGRTAGVTVKGPNQDCLRPTSTTILVKQCAGNANWSGGDALGTNNFPTAALFFWDGLDNIRMYGQGDGEIRAFGGWNGVDDVTFKNVGQITDFAYSPALARMVCVGDNAIVGYLDLSDQDVNNAWTAADNGFNPLAQVNAVDRNDNDGVFVAVANNGQICRSTSGIGSALFAPPTFTGWTLIAADPFSGTPINRIMSGAIGGDLFWVAIGGAGQLFTSTDAGVTWTQRTTGTTEGLISIGYNPDNQQFLVGCTNNTYLFSSDGISWTLDATTLLAQGATGSGNIEGLVWDTGAATWWIMFNQGASASFRTLTSPPALTTWTVREVGVSVLPPLTARKVPTGTQILYPFFQDDMQYLVGAADTTDQTYLNRTTQPKFTAVGTAPGTGGFTSDVVCGDANGTLVNTGATIGAATTRGTHTAALAGPANGIVFSTVSSRWIAVSNGNEIRTLASSDMDSDNTWYEVINPFTADIKDVWYDASDDMFIAVGSNGEIGRSTDGIS